MCFCFFFVFVVIEYDAYERTNCIALLYGITVENGNGIADRCGERHGCGVAGGERKAQGWSSDVFIQSHLIRGLEVQLYGASSLPHSCLVTRHLHLSLVICMEEAVPVAWRFTPPQSVPALCLIDFSSEAEV